MKLGHPIKVVKGGQEKIYFCPSCSKPKLHINENKGVWYCFYEGRGGNLRDLDPTYVKEQGIVHSPQERIDYESILSPIDELIRLPFGPGWDYLLSRGLTKEQIHTYAWLNSNPKYTGRVILKSPVTDYWVARSYLPGDSRYMNPPGKKLPWITKKDTRYFLVEGVFDAISLDRGGYSSAAILGGNITGDNCRYFSGIDICILLDSKSSKTTWRLMKELKWIVKSITVLLFENIFPEYKDPGDVPVSVLKERL